MEEEKKSKKGLIITILIIILLIVGLYIGWYNYKFTVTIKYNNGLDNTVEYLRFFEKVDESQIQGHLSKEGYYFIGFYETYIISSTDIEKLVADAPVSSSICRKGFNFDPNDNKCTAINAFNFATDRIVRETTIEAIWSKKEEEIVNPGRVEDATITLSADKKCVIGSGDTIDLTAKIKGYVNNKFVKWDLPNCYSAKRISETHYKLTRTKDCEESQELIGEVRVSLTNDSFFLLKVVYEPKLKIEVFDSRRPVKMSNGSYKTQNAVINTNVAATFKSKNKAIKTTSEYSISLKEKVNDTISIKTLCGQTKTVEIRK